MPYGNRKRPGKQVVMELGYGPQLSEEALIHTDGQAAHGGVATLITGLRGTGKTTLLIQYTEGTMHYPSTVHDRRYMQNLEKETAIYRVRKLDYFNTFFPSYWDTAFPGWKGKPVVMHQWVGNDYKFMNEVKGRRTPVDMSECEIIEYEDSKQLVTENIQANSINLVCEPSEYEIPGDIVKSICLRNLHFKIKMKDNEKVIKEDGDAPELTKAFKQLKPPSADLIIAKLKNDIKYKKLENKVAPQPAPTPVFWFELTERLVELKPQHEFLSMFLDESHQIFPQSPRQEHWHLVEWYATTTLDQRRMNISLFAVTHDSTLIDYRVNKRMDYSILMPGAKPDGDSLVWPGLTASLEKGEYVIEKKPGIRYGIDKFKRLKDQPPVVIADGMKNYA